MYLLITTDCDRLSSNGMRMTCLILCVPNSSYTVCMVDHALHPHLVHSPLTLTHHIHEYQVNIPCGIVRVLVASVMQGE